jgi:hypothetical protein
VGSDIVRMRYRSLFSCGRTFGHADNTVPRQQNTEISLVKDLESSAATYDYLGAFLTAILDVRSIGNLKCPIYLRRSGNVSANSWNVALPLGTSNSTCCVRPLYKQKVRVKLTFVSSRVSNQAVVDIAAELELPYLSPPSLQPWHGIDHRATLVATKA